MRILIKLVIFIILLAIAALIALPFIIDPNDYKDEISRQVERTTGRTLTLQGDIGLSVFPWIALELGPTTLSNASGFSADHFAEVEAAEIRIRLLPLLRKELEVDTIVLDGLVLNLETDKDGRTNWDDLTGADKVDSEVADAVTEVTPEATPATPALAAISIAGVRLSNANILWSDQSSGEQYQLRNMNLDTDPLVPGKPTAVKMAFDFISAQPELRAHVTLDSSVVVDLQNQQYALNKLKLTTLAEGRDLPVSQASIELTGDIQADMQQQLVNIRDLVLNSRVNSGQDTMPFGEANVRLKGQINADLANQRLTIGQLDLNANANSKGVSEALFNEAELQVTGDISSDLSGQQLQISGLNLQAKANSKGLQEPLFTEASAQMQADVSANLAEQQLQIPQLTLNSQLSRDKQKIDSVLRASIDSQLGSQQARLGDLQLTAKITDPELPGGALDLSLRSGMAINMEQQTLSISDLVLQIQDLLLNANITASNILGDKPAFQGELQLEPFNLRKLAGDLQIELPEMADSSTLSQVAVRSKFDGSSEHLALQDLRVGLDETSLAGNFAIRNFAQPTFTFDLKLDEIDADRYLPPPSEQEKPAAATPGTAATGGSDDLPLDAIRQINAKGKFEIGKLKISNIRSQNILITIDAADGLVKLTPMRAEMYQGKYQGNVVIDARGDTMQLSLDESLRGVRAGPLLEDLTGDSKITGTASASAKLTARGNNPDAIKQTLSGNGDFAFTEGALKGVNLAEAIRRARAALGGQQLPASDEPVQTDFSSMGGSFTAQNGIINNQDFELMSPLLRVNGSGTIDLPKETIDYALRVAIVGTIEGQGGRELADLRGLTIPVRITGSFDNPRPSVDLAGLLRDRATEELRGRATEQIQERLGDRVGEGLGGLLGGALAPKSEDSAPADAESDAEQSPEQEAEPAKSPEDQLKDELQNRLRRLF